MPLSSALYTGTTNHTRRNPLSNRFAYRLHLAYVDLDELSSGALDAWPLFSSRTGWSLASVLARDHCTSAGDARLPLAARVRSLAESALGVSARGPVRLLTGMRVLGMEFNPVSFYFLFDEADREVVGVVAEVNNIPWFEQHAYAIAPTGSARAVRGEMRRFEGQPKVFHVSPFIDMQHVSYSWMMTDPNERLLMKIGLERAGVPFFMAALDVTRSPFSAWNIVKYQLLYPVQTVKVVSGIMWEAFKLFRRGFTFVPHPAESETTTSRAIAFVVRTVTSARQTWRHLRERCATYCA